MNYLMNQTFNFEKHNKNYKLPPGTVRKEKSYIMNFSIEQDTKTLDASLNSTLVSTVQPKSRLLYDEYLRSHHPLNYDKEMVREDLHPPKTQQYKNPDTAFNKHFRTSAFMYQISRRSEYVKQRARSERSQRRKVEEMHNFKVTTDDKTWKINKKRLTCYDISMTTKTVEKNNNHSSDVYIQKYNIYIYIQERRYNNFIAVDSRQNRAPRIDKFTSRKPLLNNLDTPLIFYDNVNQTYQKMVYSDTGNKCTFDYNKQTQRWQQIPRNDISVYIQKDQNEQIIKQEMQRYANVLNIQDKMQKKRYNIPKFEQYLSRSRVTSYLCRQTKQNQNFYDEHERHLSQQELKKKHRDPTKLQ